MDPGEITGLQVKFNGFLEGKKDERREGVRKWKHKQW